MRTVVVFAAWVLTAGCVATPPEQAAVPPTWPERVSDIDERELLELHDGIWELIGLSTKGSKELNGIVLKLFRNIRYNENRRRELESFIIPGTLVGQSPTRAKFFENHRNRFRLLGISEETQAELFTAMDRVWRALHDPKAPEAERNRAAKIREMMVPSMPPCQTDKVLEFRERPE